MLAFSNHFEFLYHNNFFKYRIFSNERRPLVNAAPPTICKKRRPPLNDAFRRILVYFGGFCRPCALKKSSLLEIHLNKPKRDVYGIRIALFAQVNVRAGYSRYMIQSVYPLWEGQFYTNSTVGQDPLQFLYLLSSERKSHHLK